MPACTRTTVTLAAFRMHATLTAFISRAPYSLAYEADATPHSTQHAEHARAHAVETDLHTPILYNTRVTNGCDIMTCNTER